MTVAHAIPNLMRMLIPQRDILAGDEGRIKLDEIDLSFDCTWRIDCTTIPDYTQLSLFPNLRTQKLMINAYGTPSASHDNFLHITMHIPHGASLLLKSARCTPDQQDIRTYGDTWTLMGNRHITMTIPTIADDESVVLFHHGHLFLCHDGKKYLQWF
jgi:hypothetical protein